jgi:hypothetical protein
MNWSLRQVGSQAKPAPGFLETRRTSVRLKRATLGAVCAVALVGGSLAVFATSAGAVVVVDKVTICHRTNSNSNPYVEITPDVAGVLDGHAGHAGPVWDPTLKAQHIKWGDIIPPFDYQDGDSVAHFDGLNWPAGQAILENGCVPPGPPPEQQFGSLAVTKVVTGLPLEGTPLDGAIPTSFTAHVSCDDGTEQDVTFPITGGAGTPSQIDGIEAGSNCTVVEQDTAGFPTGTVVGYTPLGVDSAGAFVDANATTAVTITNDFTGVELEPEVVSDPPVTPSTPTDPPVAAPAAAPAAVQAAPAFTG